GWGRDCHVAAHASSPNHRIDFVLQAVETWGQNPGLLHELELAFDVRVEGHKEEPRIVRPALLAVVRAPNPHDTMPIGDRQLRLRSRIEAFARIGAPDMRAERTSEARRVL